MKLFKAKDGSLITLDNVNLVRIFRSEGFWVVVFDFGDSTREILFSSEKEALEELERYEAHCNG